MAVRHLVYIVHTESYAERARACEESLLPFAPAAIGDRRIELVTYPEDRGNPWSWKVNVLRRAATFTDKVLDLLAKEDDERPDVVWCMDADLVAEQNPFPRMEEFHRSHPRYFGAFLMPRDAREDGTLINVACMGLRLKWPDMRSWARLFARTYHAGVSECLEGNPSGLAGSDFHDQVAALGALANTMLTHGKPLYYVLPPGMGNRPESVGALEVTYLRHGMASRTTRKSLSLPPG